MVRVSTNRMSMTEDDLIARYFAPLAGPGGLGLTDDVALLTLPPGRDLVASVDALVAGVHFFADDPPDAIAAKALRVNLSDLAAKGAVPLGFLLSLALPRETGEDWLEGFARGLGADARAYACPLLGGDTVRTPGPLTLSITALGTVAPGKAPLRTAARAGDHLYVTGTIGDAALGLQLRLDRGPTLAPTFCDFLLERYLRPQPRLALAPALAHARAAMDVSDGLVGDLAKMLRASQVGGVLDLREVPFSDAARAWFAADATGIAIAVTGGDDYEVLAAVPRERCEAFEAAAAVPVRRIGTVREGAFEVLDLAGAPVHFAQGAYSHF